MTLPQAVELLVREMKPPITQEFGRVLQEYRLGQDFDEAMLTLANRLESRDMNMLVNAVSITRKSGGNIGEVFQKIAAGIRERGRIEGKVRALAATGKMQAIVMASMPFGIVLILYFMDAEHVQLLFSTPLGLAAVAGVLVLQVIAFVWIRGLTALDV
jgi:tight adherence protein B